MQYVITYTSLAVEADSPEEAIEYHTLNDRGGGNWEAIPVIPAACPLGLGGYDRGDIERLVELYVERLRAAGQGDEDLAAFYRGRAFEYAQQNAIAERDLPAIYELAAERLYGDGPKKGLQS